jgi:outer membrane protein assembly factor BamB
VAGGKVFIIDHSGAEDVLRAIDINTGEDAWRLTYPEPGNNNYGFARATPLIDEGKVYALGRSGQLTCADAPTGGKLWEKNVVSEFGARLPSWKLAPSPIVDGEKLIICPGGPRSGVVALDKKTGATIWAGGSTDKAGYATPVIATLGGRKQYLVFTGLALTGVDAAAGTLLWSLGWKTNYDVNAAAPVAIGTDHVFITSGYNHGCALVKVAGANASIVWENKEIKAHFSSPILHDRHIYGNSDPGHLVCMDPTTGRVLWKQRGFEKGGIVAADGVIVAQNGRNGSLIMVEMKPEGYSELGRISPFEGCSGHAWTAPIIAAGKLIARDRGSLVCIDLR